MNELLINLLRCSVSAIMNALLLFTLAQPKYGKKVMITAVLGVFSVDICSSIYFYLQGDFTTLAKFDILLFFVMFIAMKPLFYDSIMQWCFNLITTMNIFAAIVVLSYYLCDFLPYPYYANTLLRFLFFAVVILLLRRYMRPLYRRVVEHWNVFFLVVVGITLNFAYYILASEDIEITLYEQFVPLFLLILLMVFVYISIFYSLKTLSSEYALREENIKTSARQKLLQSELNSYEEFVRISRQNRHDLRHHNALLLEYLACGDIDGARAYLQQYDESIAETALRQYCQSPVANAVFRLYERRAEESGIAYAVSADIPEKLQLTAPELGVLLSNLLENACEACEKLTGPNQFIAFTANTDEERLKIELSNSVGDMVLFKDDLPVSSKQNGGIGSKSIARIISKYGGLIRFKQDHDKFVTQIVLPL